MNALEFKQKFRALINEAMTDPRGAPFAQMIVEFEVAKTKCVHIVLGAEAEAEAREAAKRIVPVTGVSLPPNRPNGG